MDNSGAGLLRNYPLFIVKLSIKKPTFAPHKKNH